jgi:hypothetical protein
MEKQFVLWGPPVIPSSSGEPGYRADVEIWMKRLSDVGITKVFAYAPELDTVIIQAGRKHDISVCPYIGSTAFPNYGAREQKWSWSLDYLRIPPDHPDAREIIETHRPIYYGPFAGEEKLEPFAKAHPEFWSLTRDKRMTLNPGEKRCMSLAFPEVRANRIQKYIDVLDRLDNPDEIQMEFYLELEDNDGAVTYGYEDEVTNAFKKETGKNAFDIPNSDPQWLQFRADYVTGFLKELREAVKSHSPEVKFSTTMIAGNSGDYIKVLQDWPKWIEQGIIDELYVWWRTDSNLESVRRQTKHISSIVNGRCPFIAEFSCYHPGSFQTPEKMLEGARIARDNGADSVGVYRSHSVDQLDFWDVLKKMNEY